MTIIISMEGMRTIKKGEHLFKAGDKASSIYAIQTGSVSVYIARPKANIELYLAGNNQFVGEQALFGSPTHLFSAVATTETKVFEVPVDVFKAQLESSSQMVKMFAKSLGDRTKNFLTELKSYRLERDNSPCPPDQVPKAFGVFYHVAKHVGNVDEKLGKHVVDWRTMKSYAQKVFLEPIKRLEQVLNIFVKLKVAETKMIKSDDDPKAPEELGFVHISDLQAIEQFFEYYQHYFYKPGKSDLLKVDEACYNLVSFILKEAESHPADRLGICRIDYGTMVDRAKIELGITLNTTNFDRLEQKGVYVKRATQDGGGVILSFDLPEFKRIFMSWRIIREIEKWNEKGFVDIHEVETKKAIQMSGKSCTGCGGEIQNNHKFCPACGLKLAA